jgi:hypothetical protein
MRLIRTTALFAATALAMLLPAAGANATAIACGGSVSSVAIGANGCISADKFNEGRVPMREIKAHVKLRNTSAHAATVEYEAFFRIVEGGDWSKMGNGRTSVPARGAAGPIEVASVSRVCGLRNPKAEIRIHVRPAGGAWSNWTGAVTAQCQT